MSMLRAQKISIHNLLVCGKGPTSLLQWGGEAQEESLRPRTEHCHCLTCASPASSAYSTHHFILSGSPGSFLFHTSRDWYKTLPQKWRGLFNCSLGIESLVSSYRGKEE